MPTTEILGIKISKLTLEETVSKIGYYIEEKEPVQIVTANAEIVYQAHREQNIKNIVNNSAIVTADGIGVVWASRLKNDPVPQKVAGVELAERLVQASARTGWRIYLFGAAPGVAEAARGNLQQKYPGAQIVGARSGYYRPEEEPAIITDIQQKKPDILFVALGFPKQEQWITDNMDKLQVPVSIGVGGSLDIFSGTKKRAPKIFVRLGLEFLYRLLQEPSRFARYLVLPKFVLTFFYKDVLRKTK